MDLSLDSVIEAARLRLAAVTPEVAGYLVLLAARELESGPARLSPDSVFLSETGQVHVRAAVEASVEAAEASLRQLLAALLALSRSPAPVLAAVAERPPEATLRGLSAELAGALIPINHAAAQRALARLYRETVRAQGITRQFAEQAAQAEPAKRAEHAEHAEHTVPPEVAPVDAPASSGAVPSPVSSGAPLAPDTSAAVALDASPVPLLVDEIDVDIVVESERPRARRSEIPASSVAGGPELVKARPEADDPREMQLDAEPHPPADDDGAVATSSAAAMTDGAGEAEAEPVATTSPVLGLAPVALVDSGLDAGEEPPPLDAAVDAAVEAPRPPPVVARAGASASEDPGGGTLSGPRSDVDVLLSAFLQHTKSDEQITRALRALVGLEGHSTQANGIRKRHAPNP